MSLRFRHYSFQQRLSEQTRENKLAVFYQVAFQPALFRVLSLHFAESVILKALFVETEMPLFFG